MDNLNVWRAWADERHLGSAGIKANRESFQRHPARVLVIDDFLRAEIAECLSRFLRAEATFQPVFGLYSRKGALIDEQEWLQADEKDRFFKFSKVAGLPSQYSLSPNAIIYLRFRKTLQEAASAGLFEQLTGLDLGCNDTFSPHSMGCGDFLRVHDDKIGNRQVALVIYLTPGWQPDFGGALVVVDRERRKTRIEAVYNRLVAFDVNAGTTHSIEVINGAAQHRRRLTISGWYGKRA